jgi:hypothetical protein
MRESQKNFPAQQASFKKQKAQGKEPWASEKQIFDPAARV